MFTEKRKLLESFKKHQYSLLSQQIHNKICNILQLDYFNPRIRQYLANFYLRSELPKEWTEYKNVYVFCKNDETEALYYVQRNGTIVPVHINDFKIFNDKLKDTRTNDNGDYLILSQDQIHSLITSNSNHSPEIGTPYLDFDKDPDNISQIKKLLNALYHAKMALEGLEKIDANSLGNTLSNLLFNHQNIINHAYQACYLATHLDIDLKEMFSEELEIVFTLLKRVQAFANQHKETKETEEVKKFFEIYPLSYKAGKIGGIVINTIQPDHKNLNYKLLTQFNGLLPSYIERFTQSIEKLSSEIAEIEPFTKTIKQVSSEIAKREPTLNPEKLQQLRETALTLLNDLENLRNNDLFASFKILNYVHIIRNIISLSMSSLEQMKYLNLATQDMIRENLTQIKYVLIPALFGLVDNIEIQSLLNPGTLSIPLMEKINKFYGVLIYYTSKAVDFKAKGEALGKIGDSRFLTLRLDNSYNRINKADKTLFKLDKIEKASEQFYNILEHPDFINQALYKLPLEIRKELLGHYKLLQPYMIQVEFELNDIIINGLKGQEFWGSYLKNTYRYLTWQHYDNQVSVICKSKNALNTLIEKKKATEHFHKLLNENLISSVNAHSNLILFPYNEEQDNILQINESRAFNPEYTCGMLKLSNEYQLKEATQYLSHEPKTLYIKVKKEGLYYEVIGINGRLFINEIPWKFLLHIPQNIATLLTDKNKYLPKILKRTAMAGHTLSPNTLKFEEIKPLLNKRSALILLNQKTLYYANAIHQSIETLIPSEINKDLFEQLMNQFEDTYQVAKKECISLITLVSGHRHLHFEEKEGAILLTNPEYLSADQALDLQLWYKNKCYKMDNAKEAYIDFIKLLPQSDLLNIQAMDQETKEKCRNFYNQFQPYFINAVPPEYKDLALKTDKFLIETFGTNSPEAEAPSINLFNTLDVKLQEKLTDIDKEWRKIASDYLILASNKFIEETFAAKLELDPTILARRHYVIQSTVYSQFINQIRQEAHKLVSQLNLSLQKRLIPQPKDVPFPELEEDNQLLAQGKQLLALKRIFNSLYHIENIILSLEQLDDRRTKGVYVTQLLYTYSCLDDLIKLLQSMDQDPYFKLIIQELYKKVSLFKSNLMKHSEDYQKDPETIAFDQKIQYNSLWYALNAFHMLPKHIKGLMNHYQLADDERIQLQINAKKATYQIESIVENSGSYFTLFLQIPKMISLYQAMSARLKEFVNTTHHAVAQNLDEFYPQIFTPMLLEADLWEDNLKLKPGTLSEPLNKMIREYYKGLLYPFTLKSHDHMALICNYSALEKRIQVTEDARNKIIETLNRIKHRHSCLDELHHAVTIYEKAYARNNPGLDFLIEDILRAYKQSLPSLHRLEKKPQLNLRRHTLYLMSELPIAKRNYQNSYFFSIKDQKLYYILGHDSEIEIRIKNSQLLLDNLNRLKEQQDANPQCLSHILLKELITPKKNEEMTILYLSHFQMKELITFNGGHKLIIEKEEEEQIDSEFDNLINTSLNAGEPHHTDIKKLIKAAYHYYKGKYSNLELELDTIEEKLSYLEQCRDAQEKEYKNYIKSYASISFTKQMQVLSNRHIGLMHTDDEYREKLQAYLLTFKKDIINRAILSEDINLEVKSQLIEKIKSFEEQYYADYFHLDRVRMALAEFKQHFGEARLNINSPFSFFEDEEILDEKSSRIIELIKIAERSYLSVDERIELITKEVKTDNFKNLILKQKRANPLSLCYLVQCLISLFETLHLYTPPLKKLLTDLKSSIDTKPKIHELTSRFGLFNQAEKNIPLPSQAHEEFDEPNQAPLLA